MTLRSDVRSSMSCGRGSIEVLNFVRTAVHAQEAQLGRPTCRMRNFAALLRLESLRARQIDPREESKINRST